MQQKSNADNSAKKQTGKQSPKQGKSSNTSKQSSTRQATDSKGQAGNRNVSEAEDDFDGSSL